MIKWSVSLFRYEQESIAREERSSTPRLCLFLYNKDFHVLTLVGCTGGGLSTFLNESLQIIVGGLRRRYFRFILLRLMKLLETIVEDHSRTIVH